MFIRTIRYYFTPVFSSSITVQLREAWKCRNWKHSQKYIGRETSLFIVRYIRSTEYNSIRHGRTRNGETKNFETQWEICCRDLSRNEIFLKIMPGIKEWIATGNWLMSEVSNTRILLLLYFYNFLWMLW